MKEDMEPKPVLFVLVEKYADWEGAFLASDIMDSSKQTGLVVKTVGVQSASPNSLGGFKTLTDFTLDTVPDDFAGLVLIGGDTWRTPEVEGVNDLLEKALQKKVPIGIICDATVFAAKHGRLNTIKHTSNFLVSMREYAGDAYTNQSNYQREPAVLDSEIVTAGGDAPAEFCRLMSKALKIASDEEIEANFVLHKDGLYAACRRNPKWQAYMDQN